MALPIQHKPVSSAKPARSASRRVKNGRSPATSASSPKRPSKFSTLADVICQGPDAHRTAVVVDAARPHPACAVDTNNLAPACLIYSPNGVLVVQCDTGRWVVPPATVLHLVSGSTYTLCKAEHVVARTIPLSDSLSQHLAGTDCLYRLTPLLRELLESLNSRGNHAMSDPQDSGMQFLVDQLVEAGVWQNETRKLCRSTPKDPRVAHICDHLYRNLDTDKTLQDWAAELKHDTRTLHRLFVQEFGMPFVQWRQQTRLLAALEWLAEGRLVMDVALDLGYQTQSAFTAMFRRNMGITPSAWQDRRHLRNAMSRQSV